MSEQSKRLVSSRKAERTVRMMGRVVSKMGGLDPEVRALGRVLDDGAQFELHEPGGKRALYHLLAKQVTMANEATRAAAARKSGGEGPAMTAENQPNFRALCPLPRSRKAADPVPIRDHRLRKRQEARRDAERARLAAD